MPEECRITAPAHQLPGHLLPGHQLPAYLNADQVIARLEEAGRALLSLPNTGPSTRLVQSGLEWIRDAGEQAVAARDKIRPAIPDAATITRMDQALAWIPLIPIDRYVLRRVVGARSLVNPMTARHLFSWRRLALAVGADHKAVQRWHGQGIDIIVSLLAQNVARPPGRGLPARNQAVRLGPQPRLAAGAPS